MKRLASLVVIVFVIVACSTVKADAGEWMGWKTYCQLHPHFAQTHKVCKPYR